MKNKENQRLLQFPSVFNLEPGGKSEVKPVEDPAAPEWKKEVSKKVEEHRKAKELQETLQNLKSLSTEPLPAQEIGSGKSPAEPALRPAPAHSQGGAPRREAPREAPVPPEAGRAAKPPESAHRPTASGLNLKEKLADTHRQLFQDSEVTLEEELRAIETKPAPSFDELDLAKNPVPGAGQWEDEITIAPEPSAAAGNDLFLPLGELIERQKSRPQPAPARARSDRTVLVSRALAGLIDLLVVLGMSLLLLFLVSFSTQQAFFSRSMGLLFVVFLLLSQFVYSFYFLFLWRRTIGMGLVGLEVRFQDDSPPVARRGSAAHDLLRAGDRLPRHRPDLGHLRPGSEVLAGHSVGFPRRPGRLTLLEDFHLHHWSRELHRRLRGQRVRAAETAGHTRLRLRWAGPGGDLLFLLAPQFPACLPARPGDPAASADWQPCAPVDAAVAGATLVAVEKVPDDRILVFSLAAGGTVFTLRAEIRPIAPALYLCSPDDSVLFSLGALRQRLLRPPDRHLRAERPGRIDPAPEVIAPFLAGHPREEWRSRLARSVRRLSPTLVEEALARAGGEASAAAVAAEVAGVCQLAYRAADRFYLYSPVPWPERDFPLDPAREVRLSSFPLASAAGWACRESRPTSGRSWPSGWTTPSGIRPSTQSKGELLRRLGERARRAAGMIHSLELQLTATEDADRLKQFGEILLAGLSRFGADFRGESITAPDLYDPDQRDIRIPLDPLKTLPENAEAYFRRHRKARQAARAVPERLDAARRRLAETESLAAAVAAARSHRGTRSRLAPAPERRRPKPASGPGGACRRPPPAPFPEPRRPDDPGGPERRRQRPPEFPRRPAQRHLVPRRRLFRLPCGPAVGPEGGPAAGGAAGGRRRRRLVFRRAQRDLRRRPLDAMQVRAEDQGGPRAGPAAAIPHHPGRPRPPSKPHRRVAVPTIADCGLRISDCNPFIACPLGITQWAL